MASAIAHKASCSRSATFARSARPSGFGSRISLHRVQRPSVIVQAEKAASAAKEVTDATWATVVLESDVPVMVDFWAPWCGPCRMIAPLIDELADEYKGKMKFVKLNTDQSPDTATNLGIRSIPTVMIFKNGNKMESVIGAVPKSTLQQALEKYL